MNERPVTAYLFNELCHCPTRRDYLAAQYRIAVIDLPEETLALWTASLQEALNSIADCRIRVLGESIEADTLMTTWYAMADWLSRALSITPLPPRPTGPPPANQVPPGRWPE